MIYLSDVDTKSGPHTYIKGSQKPFSVKMLQEGIYLCSADILMNKSIQYLVSKMKLRYVEMPEP